MAFTPEELREGFTKGVAEGKKWMIAYEDLNQAETNQLVYGEEVEEMAEKLEELTTDPNVIMLGDFNLTMDMERQIVAHTS